MGLFDKSKWVEKAREIEHMVDQRDGVIAKLETKNFDLKRALSDAQENLEVMRKGLADIDNERHQELMGALGEINSALRMRAVDIGAHIKTFKLGDRVVLKGHDEFKGKIVSVLGITNCQIAFDNGLIMICSVNDLEHAGEGK